MVKKVNSMLLGLGLVFLGYLVWKVGPGELGRQMSTLGWGVTFLILTEGIANLAHTLGWRHCISRTQPPVPLLRLFRMAMAGYAINYLTPSASVGGEVSRAALLASTHKTIEGVRSVLLDKLMTGIAHLILVLLGALLLCWRVSLPHELWVAMGIITGLLTGAMTVFLLLQKHGKLGSLCRWMVHHRLAGQSVQAASRRLSEVDESLRQFYREHPRGLVLSAAWHLMGHAAALLQVWLFLWLLGQPAPWSMVAAAAFLSLWFDLLTFAIPMNLGTLEGSRIIVFKALGCQALLGMAFGVAVRVAQLFWACFGLLSYGLLAAGNTRLTSTRGGGSVSSAVTLPADLQPARARVPAEDRQAEPALGK